MNLKLALATSVAVITLVASIGGASAATRTVTSVLAIEAPATASLFAAAATTDLDARFLVASYDDEDDEDEDDEDEDDEDEDFDDEDFDLDEFETIVEFEDDEVGIGFEIGFGL